MTIAKPTFSNLEQLAQTFFADNVFYRNAINKNPEDLKYIDLTHYYSHPIDIFLISEYLQDLKQKKASDIKILDLGSGHSYVLACFGLSGYRTYGYERNLDIVKEGNQIIKQLSLQHNPIIKIKDYMDIANFNEPFKDYTTIKDMDFIYCYPYNHKHAQEITQLLSKVELNKETLIHLNYPMFTSDYGLFLDECDFKINKDTKMFFQKK